MVMPLAGRVVAAVIGGCSAHRALQRHRDAGGDPLGRHQADAVGRTGPWTGRTGWWSSRSADSGGATSCWRRGGGDLAGPAGDVARRRRTSGSRCCVGAVRRPRRRLGLRRRRVFAVQLGFAVPRDGAAIIVFLAAATGLIVVALQIAYLRPCTRAFNRRETEVAPAELARRVPSWGPELLRAHPLRARIGHAHLNTMPALSPQWERLGGRRRREPHHVPAAGPFPLAAAAVVLGHLAAGLLDSAALSWPCPPRRRR